MNRNKLRYIAIFMLYSTNVLLHGSEPTLEEQQLPYKQYVLQVIQSIDPTAYDILKWDPTRNIKFELGDIGEVSVNRLNGLPMLTLGLRYFMSLPFNEQRFLIAHELAHYIIGHFTELYKSSYQTEKDEALLKNANYRVKENEADKMAILQFNIGIDDAIAFGRRGIARQEEDQLKHPEKVTFSRTHPLWAARIHYLEELRREVEIQKMRNITPKPVDWQGLADKYLGYLYGE